MPVRGTTRWAHAIVQKKVINFDHGGAKHVMCAWDTCEKDGFENNKVVEHQASDGSNSNDITFVFCSERHKQYFLHSTRRAGNLPPGYRRSMV